MAKSAAQQIALGYSVKTHVPGDFDLFLDDIFHSQDDSRSYMIIALKKISTFYTS